MAVVSNPGPPTDGSHQSGLKPRLVASTAGSTLRRGFRLQQQHVAVVSAANNSTKQEKKERSQTAWSGFTVVVFAAIL
jgi:hypothetical protein